MIMFSKKQTQYESDITKFIHELREHNPQLEEQQIAGRARLWDKTPIDLDTVKRNNDSKIEQKPYVYQNL